MASIFNYNLLLVTIKIFYYIVNKAQFDHLKSKIIKELSDKFELQKIKPPVIDPDYPDLKSKNPFEDMTEFEKIVHNKIRKHISNSQNLSN